MKQEPAGRPLSQQEAWRREFFRFIMSPFKAIRQRLCGIIFNHRPLSSDTGHLIGSKMCDKWCARCGKMVTIPMAEDPHYDKP